MYINSRSIALDSKNKPLSVFIVIFPLRASFVIPCTLHHILLLLRILSVALLSCRLISASKTAPTPANYRLRILADQTWHFDEARCVSFLPLIYKVIWSALLSSTLPVCDALRIHSPRPCISLILNLIIGVDIHVWEVTLVSIFLRNGALNRILTLHIVVITGCHGILLRRKTCCLLDSIRCKRFSH